MIDPMQAMKWAALIVGVLRQTAASFSHHVINIVFLCAKEQVIRIDAGGVVSTRAVMTDIHARWNCTIGQLPRDAMGQLSRACRATQRNSTVSALVFRAHPNPTTVGGGHAGPKTGYSLLMRFFETSSVAQARGTRATPRRSSPNFSATINTLIMCFSPTMLWTRRVSHFRRTRMTSLCAVVAELGAAIDALPLILRRYLAIGKWLRDANKAHGARLAASRSWAGNLSAAIDALPVRLGANLMEHWKTSSCEIGRCRAGAVDAVSGTSLLPRIIPEILLFKRNLSVIVMTQGVDHVA